MATPVTDAHMHTHMRSLFYSCNCHTYTYPCITPLLSQHPLTLMSYLITIHVHRVLPLIKHWVLILSLLLSPSPSPPPTHSWSSKLAMCPICQQGSTAPLRTMWRQRDRSRVDTSSACLLLPGTSPQSLETKVRAGRAISDEVMEWGHWVVALRCVARVMASFSDMLEECRHKIFMMTSLLVSFASLSSYFLAILYCIHHQM